MLSFFSLFPFLPFSPFFHSFSDFTFFFFQECYRDFSVELNSVDSPDDDIILPSQTDSVSLSSTPEIEILNPSASEVENTEISLKDGEKDKETEKEKESKKKKEPYIAPLKLESLLKSFFAEEIRDLSCEKCNFPSSKAKVRK